MTIAKSAHTHTPEYNYRGTWKKGHESCFNCFRCCQTMRHAACVSSSGGKSFLLLDRETLFLKWGHHESADKSIIPWLTFLVCWISLALSNHTWIGIQGALVPLEAIIMLLTMACSKLSSLSLTPSDWSKCKSAWSGISTGCVWPAPEIEFKLDLDWTMHKQWRLGRIQQSDTIGFTTTIVQSHWLSFFTGGNYPGIIVLPTTDSKQ